MTKQLWFVAKRFGYGWYPITWEGWFVVLAFVVVQFVLASHIPWVTVPGFLVLTALNVGILFDICIKKGEPARWRWG